MLHTRLKQVQFSSVLHTLRLMMVVNLGAPVLGVSYLVIYLMTATEANTNEENKTHCTAHASGNGTAIPTIKKVRMSQTTHPFPPPPPKRPWKKLKKYFKSNCIYFAYYNLAKFS